MLGDVILTISGGEAYQMAAALYGREPEDINRTFDFFVEEGPDDSLVLHEEHTGGRGPGVTLTATQVEGLSLTSQFTLRKGVSILTNQQKRDRQTVRARMSWALILARPFVGGAIGFTWRSPDGLRSLETYGNDPAVYHAAKYVDTRWGDMPVREVVRSHTGPLEECIAFLLQ